MIDIISEPCDDTYKLLLNVAQEFCVTFSLVWPDQVNFNQSAIEFEKKIQPFLQREEKNNTWPGTKLLDRMAMVRFYRYTSESLIFLNGVSRLYNWLSPNFPEDLALYRENGQCWLATIAHEADAFLDIDEKEAGYLSNRIPSLNFKFHQ